MSTNLLSTAFAFALSTGDEVTVYLADQSRLNGRFVGGSQDCFQLNAKGVKHVIRKEIVINVVKDRKEHPYTTFFSQVNEWRLSRLLSLKKNHSDWSETGLMASSFLHPSIPYSEMNYHKEAVQIAVIDSVMLLGVGYGAFIESNLGIALPFALTTFVIRRWVAKDSLYKLKTLRNEQNRLEHPNRTFCLD